MDAIDLYQRLEQDFIKPGLRDDWIAEMEAVMDCICENFRRRWMGLVCDNSGEIKKVYTAVFPTDGIMRRILESGETNALLFVHHPCSWDITKPPTFFQPMSRDLLERFRQKEISIYCLHTPLDVAGEYSTCVTLARALAVAISKTLAPYLGALYGVVDGTDCQTVIDLSRRFDEAVGHNTILYPYGSNEISGGKVAVVAGGGLEEQILKKVAAENINTFVTGITALNDYSRRTHDFAKRYRMNILGGTHYSTEAFACRAMCTYFEKLELTCTFCEGEPGLQDL